MKNRSNLMLRLASFLFVAVIASTVMLSGLLARYITSGTGSDSARVIKFGNVSIAETTNKYVICPGVDLYKDARVSFTGSESGVYVFVKMDLSSHWKSDDNNQFHFTSDGETFMEFKVDNDWKHVEGTKYVYYISLQPNDTLVNKEVLARIDDTNYNINVSEKITMDDLAKLVNDNAVDIDFTATVVQSNGFNNAAEAWASVKEK